jgi:hypothetical protein
MSVGGSSYKDLQLGFEHGLVGCNGGVFGSAKTVPGSLVLIMANKKNPTTREQEQFISLGVLGERVASCDLWQSHGGHLWEFNFRYTPLTPILCITPEIKSFIAAFCADHDLKAKNVFHYRFCSVKLLSVFIALIEAGHFPLL